VSIYYLLTLFLVNFKLMYKHKKIFDRVLGYAPFIICFIILYLSETFNVISSINGLTQLILFIIVVSIPAFITKRMSYVDIGWPWGLVLLGRDKLKSESIFLDGIWFRGEHCFRRRAVETEAGLSWLTQAIHGRSSAVPDGARSWKACLGYVLKTDLQCFNKLFDEKTKKQKVEK
jgi:hypothetical protein